VVGSLREVNWQRVQPNFFVVFPEGVLEAAPQFHVVVTRTDDATLSAETQRAVVTRFPNMSIIDLTLILSTLDVILDKVGLVIRFMAFFSVFTGLIVLIGVVTNSRYQRVRESILLKTLGGTRRQILRIMIVEYLLLGFIAGITGVILSLAGGWALTRWVFEITFYPDPIPTLAVIAAVALVTVIVGMLASRGIHERAPLEILRAEG
jgi:putative ABC transport system permease protein